MKKLLLLIGLLFPLLGFSQSPSDQKQRELLGQGHISAGVNIGGAFVRSSTGVTRYVAPHIHYFLQDGWSIGFEGRYQVNDKFLNYTGFGLSSRYYFVRDRRLALFGQLGASLGQSKFSAEALDAALHYLPTPTYSYERHKGWQTNAGLGAHLRIAKKLSLEVLGERATTQFTRTVSYRRWLGSVGINFLLK